MTDTWSTTNVDNNGNVTTTVNLHELLNKLSRKGEVRIVDTCTGHEVYLTDAKGAPLAMSSHDRVNGRSSLVDALAQLASMMD